MPGGRGRIRAARFRLGIIQHEPNHGSHQKTISDGLSLLKRSQKEQKKTVQGGFLTQMGHPRVYQTLGGQNRRRFPSSAGWKSSSTVSFLDVFPFIHPGLAAPGGLCLSGTDAFLHGAQGSASIFLKPTLRGGGRGFSAPC